MFYIYIRSNIEDIYKLGSTNNLYNRNQHYITNEYTKQNFIKVYKFYNNNKLEVENKIHKLLINYHIYNNSGIEFYKKDILKIIDNIIIENFKNETYEDIKNINYEIFQNRINYFKNIIDKSINKHLEDIKNNIHYSNFQLYNYQYETINKMINYYKNNNKGILNWICRLGKTPTSLYYLTQININNCIIFVSNNLLLKQWKKQIENITNFKPYIFKSNKQLNITNQDKKYIIICHYINSLQLLNFINNNKINIDFKIYDEFHHLTSYTFNLLNNNDKEKTKKYYYAINIKSNYILSLSATLKIINNINEDNKEFILSNDDINKFGNIIDIKTFNDGLKLNKLCNFELLIDEYNYNNINDCNNINIILENSLKSVIKYLNNNIFNKCIFFVNNINNINYCIDYLNKNKDNNFNNINYLRYDYKNKCDLNNINNFNKIILFSIYACGEGIDLPDIDAVCISENMTTNIRITQSLLRPMTYKPNKKAYILLTFNNINDNNNLTLLNDYNKIINIINILKSLDININEHIKINNNKLIKLIYDNVINNYNLLYNDAKNIILSYNLKNNNIINSIKSYRDNCFNISTKLYYYPELKYNNFKWIDYLNLNIPSIDKIKEIINLYCYENSLNKNEIKYNFKNYYYLIFKFKFNYSEFISYYNKNDLFK